MAAVFATADFLAGGGEMGARARRLDWSQTPLGPVARWPQSLRTAASTMLASRHPMFVAWGPELVFIYNDGYATLLGDRHPEALGRRLRHVWAEVWAEIAPLVASALSGQATWSEDSPFILTRRGYPEEAWFTFSYSPIRDETGQVGGMLCACNETTAKVLAERRLNFQLELSQRQRAAPTAGLVVAEAARMLGETLVVDRCAFTEVEPETGWASTEQAWSRGVLTGVAGRHALAILGRGLEVEILAGRPVIIDDRASDPRVNPETFTALGITAILAVPLVRQGGTVAMLSVQSIEPRRWCEEDQVLVVAALEQTWSALQAARAEAALRDSERRMREVQAAGQVGSVDWDLLAGTVHRSQEYLALHGLPADFPKTGDFDQDWLLRVHPDDRAEVEARFRDNLSRGGAFEQEYRIVRPDNGEVRWIYNHGRAEADETGRGVRMISVQTDITARKRDEARRQLLVNELNHRVKNTLATIQSIAHQTLRTATSLEGACGDLENRLIALSRAHDVLTRETWEGANLTEIVTGAVGPYAAEGRADYRGPDVWLSPGRALALAMALHELAVNAAKYGALTGDSGRVDVAWRIGRRQGVRRLHLTWTESGGPPVTTPVRRGFGARLLERGLGRDLGGEVWIDFAPKGVVCRVEATLA